MNDAILSERLEAATVSRLDILAFLASFIGGLAVYVIFRFLGVPQLIITLSIVLVMGVYATAVARVPRLRLRLDQAGDNAYYLGLLFTLFSMAVALYEFSVTQLGTHPAAADGSGAKRIIGNFGIALGTTIAGIFLRLLLHQMRVDPADVESMTRIELAEAAKRVKATLDGVSLEMGRFLDEMRQRTSDQLSHLMEQVSKTLVDFTSNVTTATAQLVEATSTAQNESIERLSKVTNGLVKIAEEAETAVGRLRQVEPPPEKLAMRLGNVSDVLDKVAGQAERLGTHLTNAATTLVDVSISSARQQQEGLKLIADAAAKVKEVLESVGDTLEEDRQRLATLEEQSKKSAQAVRDSQDATDQVLGNLVQMTRGLTEFINRRD